MAFNRQTFKTRALTAIVFVAVMIFGLLFNRWSSFLLFSIVHFGAWVEYQKLIGKINKDYSLAGSGLRYATIIAGWCLLLFFTNQQLQIFDAHLTTIGWWLGIGLLVIIPLILLIQSPTIFFQYAGYSLFGIL